jgi:hypothetical protein
MHSFKRGDEVWFIRGWAVYPSVVSNVSTRGVNVRDSNGDVVFFGIGDVFRAEGDARTQLAVRLEHAAKHQRRLVSFLRKETVQ